MDRKTVRNWGGRLVLGSVALLVLVMLGAAPQMASLFPNIDFDSAVSRQVSVAVQLLRQRAASNALLMAR